VVRGAVSNILGLSNEFEVFDIIVCSVEILVVDNQVLIELTVVEVPDYAVLHEVVCVVIVHLSNHVIAVTALAA
jgi:hypothetical protein